MTAVSWGAGASLGEIGALAEEEELRVDGGVQVGGHLDGECAAWAEGGEEAGEDCGVVGNSLQGGVGVDDVPGGGVGPGAEISLGEGGGGGVCTNADEHGGVVVDSNDHGVGPAGAEQGSGVAPDTAEVDKTGGGIY